MLHLYLPLPFRSLPRSHSFPPTFSQLSLPFAFTFITFRQLLLAPDTFRYFSLAPVSFLSLPRWLSFHPPLVFVPSPVTFRFLLFTLSQIPLPFATVRQLSLPSVSSRSLSLPPVSPRYLMLSPATPVIFRSPFTFYYLPLPCFLDLQLKIN